MQNVWSFATENEVAMSNIVASFGGIDMTKRRAPYKYNTNQIVRQAIGHGNYVILDGCRLGPMVVSGDKRNNSGFTLAGTGSLANTSSGKLIPAEKVLERIATALRQSSQELSTDLAKARRESAVFFRLIWLFSIVGFAIVLVSVGLVFGGRSQEGLIGTAASVVSELLAAVFFRKDRELRQVVDRYHSHVVDHHKFLTMIDISETLSDPVEQDQLKRHIVSILLQQELNNSKSQ
jgi:Cyanobacterial TRADD-N associated 2-Transmembrane domain